MTTVSIFSENPGSTSPSFRAVAGDQNATGRTAGEALDALSAQTGDVDLGTLLVFKSLRPDRFFTAAQQQRLGELMERWRNSRDNGLAFPADEMIELNALVEAELRGAGNRAAAMASVLGQ